MDGHHVILQKSDDLASGDSCFLANRVPNVKCGVVVQDLVRDVVAEPIPQSLGQGEGIKDVPDDLSELAFGDQTKEGKQFGEQGRAGRAVGHTSHCRRKRVRLQDVSGDHLESRGSGRGQCRGSNQQIAHLPMPTGKLFLA